MSKVIKRCTLNVYGLLCVDYVNKAVFKKQTGVNSPEVQKAAPELPQTEEDT